MKIGNYNNFGKKIEIWTYYYKNNNIYHTQYFNNDGVIDGLETYMLGIF